MSKKRSWLSLFKRFLFPESHHHHQQKIKRRRWLFGRLKRTKTLPSLSPPSPKQSPPIQLITRTDHKEEIQSKCEDHNEGFECEIEVELFKPSEIVTNDQTPLRSQHESHVLSVAAIKIQTVYRGFLAKKALRALKGFVRLQAIIRGWAVRRQAMTTLKCLQSIAKIQSEVCARRCQLVRVKDDDLQLQDVRNQSPKILKQRRRDDNLLSKDEEISIVLRKKEAILRSQRIKAYSFNHRHSADSEDGTSHGRLRYWLEQYADDELSKKNENVGGKQHNPRSIDGLNNLDITLLFRRSYHKYKTQNFYGEDSLHSNSPSNLPTYMAATESAKARSRSTSSPRLRPLHYDAYSDGDSPYKHKLTSPMSSINSAATCSGFNKVSYKSSYSSCHQKSPSLKGVSGPVRSNKNLK